MKRLIIATIVLLAAAAFVTVLYFKNLNTPGQHTDEAMRSIPDNAALVFEFNNDNGFYDIFSDNKLFAAVVGEQKLNDLYTLRNQLLADPSLQKYFSGQSAFISLHPSKSHSVELLLTIAAAKGFNAADIDQIAKQSNKRLLVAPVTYNGKKGYTIYSSVLKKRFYLLNKEDGIYSGSFSKDLVDLCASYTPKTDTKLFLPLPDQQNSNSLANLYVNYSRLDPLFQLIFENKNTDIFKSFRMLPALAALN